MSEEEAETDQKESLLTPAQKRVFDAIAARDIPPTLRDLMKDVGVKSPNGIVCTLRILERKGFIERSSQQSRGIRVIPQWHQVPACILALAKWLVTDCGLDSPLAVLRVVESPKDYDSNWEAMCVTRADIIDELQKEFRWRK